MTPSELAAARAKAKELIPILQDALTGCSDGFCAIGGPAKGMHTNGGCRCWANIADLSFQLATVADSIRNYRS